MSIILVIALLTWWTLGYNSFKFWWKKDFDFTREDRRMALIIGILGPITFLIGYFAHTGSRGKEVLERRK